MAGYIWSFSIKERICDYNYTSVDPDHKCEHASGFRSGDGFGFASPVRIHGHQVEGPGWNLHVFHLLDDNNK